MIPCHPDWKGIWKSIHIISPSILYFNHFTNFFFILPPYPFILNFQLISLTEMHKDHFDTTGTHFHPYT